MLFERRKMNVLLAKKHPHGLWEKVDEFASLEEASAWLSEKKDPRYRVFAAEDWERVREQRLTVDTFTTVVRDTVQDMDGFLRSLSDAQMEQRVTFFRDLWAKHEPRTEDAFTISFADNMLAAAFVGQPCFSDDEFARLARAAMQRLRDYLRRDRMLEELRIKEQRATEKPDPYDVYNEEMDALEESHKMAAKKDETP